MFGWLKKNPRDKLKESNEAVAAAREALKQERIAMQKLMEMTLGETQDG